MKSLPPFQFTPDDLAILKIVYDCRIITVEHLMAITGRSYSALMRRIEKLLAHHYLATPFPKHVGQKYVYALGRSAKPVLISSGIAPPQFQNERLRHKELSETFLPHNLKPIDLHAIFHAAFVGTPYTLAESRSEHELHDRVTFIEHGASVTLPVRPDRFFRIQDTRATGDDSFYPLLVEADRSTMTIARMIKKYQAYFHYFKQRLHAPLYGVRIPRVLTVAPTLERAANLCAAAARIIPRDEGRAYYLFASFEFVTLKNPDAALKPIYLMPHSSTLHPLFPRLAAVTTA